MLSRRVLLKLTALFSFFGGKAVEPSHLEDRIESTLRECLSRPRLVFGTQTGHVYISFRISDSEYNISEVELRDQWILPNVLAFQAKMTLTGGQVLEVRRGTGALQRIVTVDGEPFRLTLTYDGVQQGHLVTIEHFSRES